MIPDVVAEEFIWDVSLYQRDTRSSNLISQYIQVYRILHFLQLIFQILDYSCSKILDPLHVVNDRQPPVTSFTHRWLSRNSISRRRDETSIDAAGPPGSNSASRSFDLHFFLIGNSMVYRFPACLMSSKEKNSNQCVFLRGKIAKTFSCLVVSTLPRSERIARLARVSFGDK